MITRVQLGGSERLPHLDSLRALAVAVIVLFHLDVPGFQFGYLGVDIFFMLSGFLMTRTMLYDRQVHGNFRVREFFVRRFKRIVPSLLVTVAVTLCAAYILMSPEQLLDTVKQGVSAQLFLSNTLFFHQSGYFAPENDVRALLHTWSLSVEEQFYILFGLMLAVGNRINFLKLIVGVAIASLALLLAAYVGIFSGNGFLGIGQPENYETAVFYLTPFRIVQFMAGALIAAAPSRTQRLSVASYEAALIAIVLIGGVLLSKFQSAQKISALVIIATFSLPLMRSTLLETIGRTTPIRFLAKISYQIYLVHWPLIVFRKYWTFEPLSVGEQACLGILSIVLGWCLFELARMWINRQATVSVSAFAMSGCVLLEATAAMTGGALWRIPDQRALLTPTELRDAESRYCNGTEMFEGRQLGARTQDPLVTCVNKRPGEKTIYVLGDSHARHLLPGLSETYRDYTIAVMYFTSCPAQSGVGDFVYNYGGRPVQADACVSRNQQMLKFFANAAPSIILIHQFSGYEGDTSVEWFSAARILLETLQRQGHRVLWIGSVVRPNKLLTDCISVPAIYTDATLARRCGGDQNIVAAVVKKNVQLAALFPDSYVNINDFFCTGDDAASCATIKNGAVLFRDEHHLTPQASIALVERLRENFSRIAK